MARDRQWVVLDPAENAGKAREPTAREIIESEEARKDAPAPCAPETGRKPDR